MVRRFHASQIILRQLMLFTFTLALHRERQHFFQRFHRSIFISHCHVRPVHLIKSIRVRGIVLNRFFEELFRVRERPMDVRAEYDAGDGSLKPGELRTFPLKNCQNNVRESERGIELDRFFGMETDFFPQLNFLRNRMERE